MEGKRGGQIARLRNGKGARQQTTSFGLQLPVGVVHGHGSLACANRDSGYALIDRAAFGREYLLSIRSLRIVAPDPHGIQTPLSGCPINDIQETVEFAYGIALFMWDGVGLLRAGVGILGDRPMWGCF